MTDSELVKRLNQFFHDSKCYEAYVEVGHGRLRWMRHSSGWRLCFTDFNRTSPLEEWPLPTRIEALKVVPSLYRKAKDEFDRLYADLTQTVASINAWLQVEEASSPIRLSPNLPD